MSSTGHPLIILDSWKSRGNMLTCSNTQKNVQMKIYGIYSRERGYKKDNNTLTHSYIIKLRDLIKVMFLNQYL